MPSAFEELPPLLREAAERNWSRLTAPPDPERLPALARVFACSDFIAAAVAAEPDLLQEFAADRLAAPRTRVEFAVRLTVGTDITDFRRRELARIAWRDLAGLASLEVTLRELSDLADACIHAAQEAAETELIARHGTPRDANGQRQRLVVLAMGKLGAHELNLSSDIDLIFAWPEPGATDGAKQLTNEEFFVRLGRKLVQQLAAYRVDMRLRPFGDSGPLALSFGALEAYYQEHGRDWERYALIKARPVTGDAADGARLLDLLRPFVYRRYLDFGSFEQLRRMKAKITREVARRELADNVKLGPGGIREVEFIGQAYQLIRGGRETALQERGILRVLECLGERRHLAASAVADLTDAYHYLRCVENRMQAQADQQVHELPADDLGRARLALSMGCKDWAAFRTEFDAVRATVTRHFETVFFAAEPAAAGVWREEEGEDAVAQLAAAGFADPAAIAARLIELRRGAYWRALGDAGRERLDQLVPMALKAAAEHPNPDEVLVRLLGVVEAIDRRISYLALLIENPSALTHLARLCSASSLVAERVARTPLLLDELLDSRIFTDPPTREALEAELAQMLEGVRADDLERQMDALRAFYHSAVLHIAVADLTDMLPLMKVSDRLTDIAEIIIGRALEFARAQMVVKHGEPGGGFAVIAYGKLGGLELAYGSDLDLVFLHDAEGDASAVFFARLAQRLVHLLATPTAAGSLYEVDTRLRPSGVSGLLVSSLEAFTTYQANEAWTWEHQALLRARPIAGEPRLAGGFARVRREVLTRARDVDALRGEVATMRARMRTELAAAGAGEFDLKQGAGGIADIEFLVQYLVLANAHRFPVLVDWPDNIRQLETLVEVGVLETATGERLADAYRALRERVHRLGLQGRPARAPDEDFQPEREFVADLWRAIIEP